MRSGPSMNTESVVKKPEAQSRMSTVGEACRDAIGSS
jgi:hypothetical protein